MNPEKKLKKEWKSDEPNPDEEFLKAEFEAEASNIEAAIIEKEEAGKRKEADIEPLIKASGLTKEDIDKKGKELKSLSKSFIMKAEPRLLKPSFDIDATHSRELKEAKEFADKTESSGNPFWRGYVWHPSYGGWSGSWWGLEEIPSCSWSTSNNRIDPKAQAWGWGCYSGDYSIVNGYLAFRFTPPSWGNLRIYVNPWLHGYYNVYSHDFWWSSAEARGIINIFVKAYQYRWEYYHLNRVLYSSGSYVCDSGRIDAQNWPINYYMQAGAGDPVTVKVGVNLWCDATAAYTSSVLDFQTGVGNYVYVPYIYWELRQ